MDRSRDKILSDVPKFCLNQLQIFRFGLDHVQLHLNLNYLHFIKSLVVLALARTIDLLGILFFNPESLIWDPECHPECHPEFHPEFHPEY